MDIISHGLINFWQLCIKKEEMVEQKKSTSTTVGTEMLLVDYRICLSIVLFPHPATPRSNILTIRRRSSLSFKSSSSISTVRLSTPEGVTAAEQLFKQHRLQLVVIAITHEKHMQ